MSCFQASNSYTLGTCSISVSYYGAVGDVVVGSFSGVLVSFIDAVRITEGTFTAKRMD